MLRIYVQVYYAACGHMDVMICAVMMCLSLGIINVMLATSSRGSHEYWLCRLDSGQLQHRFLHHVTLQGERDEAHGGQFQER